MVTDRNDIMILTYLLTYLHSYPKSRDAIASKNYPKSAKLGMSQMSHSACRGGLCLIQMVNLFLITGLSIFFVLIHNFVALVLTFRTETCSHEKLQVSGERI